MCDYLFELFDSSKRESVQKLRVEIEKYELWDYVASLQPNHRLSGYFFQSPSNDVLIRNENSENFESLDAFNYDDSHYNAIIE